MTDRSDDFARIEEIANELQRLRIDAQQIGIDLTAGQHDRVVVIRTYFAEHFVDGDALTPILVLPAANLTLLRRYDYDFGARVPQPLQRHLQLGLLEAMRRENDHFCFADFWHHTPPSVE